MLRCAVTCYGVLSHVTVKAVTWNGESHATVKAMLPWNQVRVEAMLQ